MATNYCNDANCQGAWLFDDDLTDESGEGNTLTDNGSIAYSTTRPNSLTSGKSAQFDGSSDYLTRAHNDLSASFPGKGANQDWAYCLWIYTDITNASQYWFNKGNSFWGYFNDSSPDTLKIGQYDNGWDADETDILSSPSATTWYHVAVSINGDGTNTGITYWISTSGGSFGDTANGTTDTWANVAELMDASGDTSAFCIGGQSGGSDKWDGYIYQPIIFNRTITSTEASNMYSDGIDGSDGAAASVVPIILTLRRRMS